MRIQPAENLERPGKNDSHFRTYLTAPGSFGWDLVSNLVAPGWYYLGNRGRICHIHGKEWKPILGYAGSVGSSWKCVEKLAKLSKNGSRRPTTQNAPPIPYFPIFISKPWKKEDYSSSSSSIQLGRSSKISSTAFLQKFSNVP